MSSNTVRIVATLVAKEGRAVQLGDLLRGLVAPTRREPGCRRYELWQNEANAGEFRFIEEWESPEAVDSHFETAHVKGALSQLPELVAGELDLRRYRLVE